VADAPAARATYKSQVAFEQQLVDADMQNYKLSKMRFDAGVDSSLTVLVAQSSLFSAQIKLIAVKLPERQNLITLCKALGGGWLGRSRTAQAPSGGGPRLPKPFARANARTNRFG
jgi:multidrug efflux system outer membrane protein